MPLIEIKNRYTGEVIHAGEYADLREAVLKCVADKANLRSADLRYANLSFANLRYADLRSANLSSADLRYAENAELVKAMTVVVPAGELRVWKKCSQNVIVHLLIPADARRSNATGASAVRNSQTCWK